jgi:5-methylcytosine-specific restriction endonuclease McrA
LKSRVDNCYHWAKRIQAFAPLVAIAVETVRFDTQLMQNPEISSIEYQQGTLVGYEIREYLLEKFNRTCVYCGAKDVPFQVEHVRSKRRSGSNRVSNLAISCESCNQEKDTRDVREFLAGKPDILKTLLAQTKAPLHDAAAVNATRYAIGNALKTLGLPVTFWSGGRTKHNRSQQNYPKAHWIDAACVGETGRAVRLTPTQTPLQIKAAGRGSRQMCRMDRFGFPRTSAKGAKTVRGFRTGDMVRADVPSGKKAGTHIGRVAVRISGSFNITTTAATVQGISHKHCRLIHRADGYGYSTQASA